eukprot:1751032-Amphidinium_carterae.1
MATSKPFAPSNLSFSSEDQFALRSIPGKIACFYRDASNTEQEQIQTTRFPDVIGGHSRHYRPTAMLASQCSGM